MVFEPFPGLKAFLPKKVARQLKLEGTEPLMVQGAATAEGRQPDGRMRIREPRTRRRPSRR